MLHNISNTMNVTVGEFSVNDTNFDDGHKVGNIVMYMNVIGIPCFVLIGVCGNTISFVVFVCTHLKYKSSSIYLASLNVVDTGFLISLIPAWLGWVHIEIFHSDGWCQTTIYSAYVFAFLSVWIVVAFTVERFVVVYYPLKRSEICTVRRAVITVVLLSLFALLFYSYALWTTSVQPIKGWPTCSYKMQYQSAFEVLAAVDTIITLLIPSIAIFCFNGSISMKLILYYKKHSHLSSELQRTEKLSSSGSDNRMLTENPNDSSHSSRKSRVITSDAQLQQERRRNFQNRTTRTLLVISTIFILFNLPSHAFRIYILGMELTGQQAELSYTMATVQELCLLIYYANFASNLFLYTICSKSFRVALVKLNHRCKRRLIYLFTVCRHDTVCAKWYHRRQERKRQRLMHIFIMKTAAKNDELLEKELAN